MKTILANELRKIEQHLHADVLVFNGELVDGVEAIVKRLIEELAKDRNKHDALYVILTTTGGSLSPVKRMVDVLRHFYNEVSFIIPDYAYSAGTVMCTSGDKIFMSYYSALGPIDPQVKNKDGNLVSALGYLDKINELLDKARRNELSNAEFIILKDFDLAELRAYEQARDFAVDLLKEWLPKYKFKDWNRHASNGEIVTPEEKTHRANEIAVLLSNNNEWKMHGRPINKEELEKMKLVIDDLEDDKKLYELISRYYELMKNYMEVCKTKWFFQTRRFL